MDISSQTFEFLGREFLTWLWFKSEVRNGSVMIPGFGDIEIVFLRRLVFESGEGDYSETIVCRGFRTDLKEGKTALREGKKIKEARIKLGMGSEEWEFTFKADRFCFQSMALPSHPAFDEEEKDREAQLIDRIGMAETAVGTMERLFHLFVSERLEPTWRSETLPRIQMWLADKTT